MPGPLRGRRGRTAGGAVGTGPNGPDRQAAGACKWLPNMPNRLLNIMHVMNHFPTGRIGVFSLRESAPSISRAGAIFFAAVDSLYGVFGRKQTFAVSLLLGSGGCFTAASSRARLVSALPVGGTMAMIRDDGISIGTR